MTDVALVVIIWSSIVLCTMFSMFANIDSRLKELEE